MPWADAIYTVQIYLYAYPLFLISYRRDYISFVTLSEVILISDLQEYRIAKGKCDHLGNKTIVHLARVYYSLFWSSKDHPTVLYRNWRTLMIQLMFRSSTTGNRRNKVLSWGSILPVLISPLTQLFDGDWHRQLDKEQEYSKSKL